MLSMVVSLVRGREVESRLFEPDVGGAREYGGNGRAHGIVLDKLRTRGHASMQGNMQRAKQRAKQEAEQVASYVEARVQERRARSDIDNTAERAAP